LALIINIQYVDAALHAQVISIYEKKKSYDFRVLISLRRICNKLFIYL